MTQLRRPTVIACLIAIVGAAAFMPSISGGWIYDDHLLIPENPYIHSFDHWPRWFMTDFWDVGEEFVRLGARITYWRPAITMSYALDWKLGGGSPLMFHVTNYLWQAGVGALAFLVLRRWLDATWPAVVAALLFVVHPTKAESVAWIAGRTDVICMVAVLVVSEGVSRRLRGAPGGMLLEFLGTLLAYTTKEQAIVLPAFVAIEAWVAAGRPAIDRRSITRMLRVAAPQTAIAIAYLVMRRLLLPIQPTMSEGASQSFIDHMQAVLETIGRFVTLTFAPHGLSIQHGLVRVVDGHHLHSLPYVVLGASSILAMVGVAVIARRRAPAVTLGLTFFLMTLAPTSNLVNTQMKTLVSERFLYLPLLGVTFAIGGCLALWPRRWAYAIVALAIAAAAWLAVDRAIDYSDEDRFWVGELQQHPDSGEARRGRMRAEIRAKHYRAALLDALEMTRTSSQNEDLPAASDIAQLLADLTPDHDRATLSAIDTFCEDLIARKQPEAVLSVNNLTFRIPTGNARYEMFMKSYELRLLALRTSLRSRLTDDATALALARQGLEKCPRCPSIVSAAALTYARAGEYDDALSILDSGRGRIAAGPLEGVRAMIVKSQGEFERARSSAGPAQLQAQAAALAALELWGRAYDVLAPYADQIKGAPGVVKGFAELAVRAGEPQVARSVLAGSMPADEIENAIATWSRTMGWAN